MGVAAEEFVESTAETARRTVAIMSTASRLPIVIERDTVTELIVAATLRVDVPLERGGELAVAAQDVLESLAIVRYADVRELGAVDAGDDGLSVAIDCRLTLHVDDATAAATTARRALRETDRVLGVDRFETVDGPYRIERW